MTISAENFVDMDSPWQVHQDELEQKVGKAIQTGEWFETSDLAVEIRVSELVDSYARLASRDLDGNHSALRSGVEKAILAGHYMGKTILGKTAKQSTEDLDALPMEPDQSDIDSLVLWARGQAQTGKLAMQVAERIAENEGDTGLTSPLSLIVGLALYHTALQSRSEQAA